MVDTKSWQVPLSLIYIDIQFDVYGALLLLTYWLCQSGISKIVQLLVIVILVNQTQGILQRESYKSVKESLFFPE